MDVYRKWIKRDDRLFANVTAATMSLYIITVFIFIRLKSDAALRMNTKTAVNRFTRLIVDLPLPPPEAAPQKKIIQKEQIEVKEQQETKPEVKPVRMRKKEIKKVEPVPENSKKEVKNLENMGMLQLIGAISDSIEGVDSVDDAAILTFSDSIGENGNDDLEMFDTESILSFDDIDSIKAQNELDLLAMMDENYINSGDETDVNSLKVTDSNKAVIKKESGKPDDTRSMAFIEKKVSAYSDGIKFCYDNRLIKEVDISGKIVLQFTIISSGNTENVSILSDEINDTNLQRCILELVSRWRFPSSDSGKVVITYPLSFTN